MFNGADVMQRAGGRWHYVTSGSAGLQCGRYGIPVAVRQDLHLACAVGLPTGPAGARHLQSFLSPDRKVWCLSDVGMPGFPFSCAASPAPLGGGPEFSAYLSNQGNVTICRITHLIQQPGHPTDSCFVNWDVDSPVLRVGEQNFVDGVLCKSLSTGITCTLTAGAGKGKGFLINSTSVTRVAPRANVAAEHFRACGNFNALHVGIDVYRVSCAKSRRIVRAYLHGKAVGGDFARVKGFAAWMCSTGDRSGGCEKGGFARGVPQIDFFYLVPPG